MIYINFYKCKANNKRLIPPSTNTIKSTKRLRSLPEISRLKNKKKSLKRIDLALGLVKKNLAQSISPK